MINEEHLQEDIKEFEASLCAKYNRAIRLRYNINRISLAELVEIIHSITGYNVCLQTAANPTNTIRQLYYKFADEYGGFTRREIGAMVMRNHSTVTCGIKAVNDRLSVGDEKTIHYYKMLKNYLK